MKTIAVSNMKGGVGKTHLAVHLATGLAERHRVLLIDLDGQGNSTKWLCGKMPSRAEAGVTDLLLRETLEGQHLRQVAETLWVVPGDEDLKAVEPVLASKIAGQCVLRDALKAFNGQKWDYVIIDCSPTMGYVVCNALCAADWVLAPVNGTAISLEGLPPLDQALALCRQKLGATAAMLGYVIFGANEAQRQLQLVRETLAKAKGKLLFRQEIRKSAAGEELFNSRSLAWGGADPKGCDDYRAVLRETMRRMEAA